MANETETDKPPSVGSSNQRSLGHELQNRDVMKRLTACREAVSKQLDLSRMKIESLPDLLFKLRFIQYLYLEGNHLSHCPATVPLNLLNLKWLDLRNNRLTSLPSEISMLQQLKTLLLEGNHITRLPLELSNMKNLSGLNISDNPLESPPAEVIEKGTQAILSYLRELMCVEQRFGRIDLSDARHASCSDDEYVDYNDDNGQKIKRQYERESVDTSLKSDEGKPAPQNTRRISLEEHALQGASASYSLSHSSYPKHVTNQHANDRVYSAPIRKMNRKHCLPPAEQIKSANARPLRSSLLPTQAEIERKARREAKNAAMKVRNDKVEEVLQKKKDSSTLSEWRKEAKKHQINKYRQIRVKHEMNIPFGTEATKLKEDPNSHGAKVKELLTKEDKNEVLRILRDTQLESRIQEHATRLKNWKQPEMTVEEEVQAAKHNLDRALELQKDFDEKRALEYRLQAFTRGEFVPHAKRKSKN